MAILGNSVWSANNVLGMENGFYRVILVISHTKEIVLFPILEEKTEIKPICFPLDLFEEAIADKSIVKSSFELPSFMQRADSEISDEELRKREHNFSLIKGLVEDTLFIYDYGKA